MKEQTNHENARTLSRFPSDKLCSGKKWDSNEERAPDTYFCGKS